MFRREARHVGDEHARAALAWEVAWAVELGERIDASPIVVEDGVVIATRKGTVVLLDPETGAERARAELGGGGIWATPTAAKGVVVVGVVREKGGELVGLDARTLAVRWRRVVSDANSFGAGTAQGEVVWLCEGRFVVGVRVGDGAETARRDVGANCFGAPAIDGDLMYVASRTGELWRFDGDATTPAWTARMTKGVPSDTAPVVGDGLVLVGSNDGTMYAFSNAGELVWKVEVGAWVVSAPAIVDGKVIFGHDGDREQAVDLRDGHEIWNGSTGGDVASSAVVIGEYAIHGAHDGKVHAWRVADGAPLEPIDAGGKLFASPAVTREGAVVIATQEGRVLAIR
jgi:outer membrane protein assembly factor BamB